MLLPDKNGLALKVVYDISGHGAPGPEPANNFVRKAIGEDQKPLSEGQKFGNTSNPNDFNTARV